MELSRRQFSVLAAATPVAARASDLVGIQLANPFRIDWPASEIRDLQIRLERTRWSDAVVEDWSYGMAPATARQLHRHWKDDYDWGLRLAALNRFPHRKTVIDGTGIHYLHFASGRPHAPALMLLNGWPSSFIEFARLGEIERFLKSGTSTAFDIVIPSVPGFGYSDRPTSPWQHDPSNLFHQLMTTILGYRHFAIAASDIGVGIATRMALHYPETIKAMLLGAVTPPPLSAGAVLTPDEQAFQRKEVEWDATEGGYQAIQATRPQTLAFALADSPIGCASWIVEKFRNWSDCGGDVFSVFPADILIDNVMNYWMTGTIGSSIRYYRDVRIYRPPLPESAKVLVPTSFVFGPHELSLPPKEWAERLYNVRSLTRAKRGGHFLAWEDPETYRGLIEQAGLLD